jgi:hypothetical protein
MPRRANSAAAAAAAQVDSDNDNDGGDTEMTGSSFSGAPSGPAPSEEVLRARAREWLDYTQQIKELGAQVAVLRKNLKGVEKALLNGMILLDREELEVDGVKLGRTKKLQLVDQ